MGALKLIVSAAGAVLATAFVAPLRGSLSPSDLRSPATHDRSLNSIPPQERQTRSPRRLTLHADKQDAGTTGEGESSEPMDLDLEQMFEVFDAADKEVSDEAVGRKPTKKTSAQKDPAEAVGDMLSSLFGGGK